jgi:hypothetical protein
MVKLREEIHGLILTIQGRCSVCEVKLNLKDYRRWNKLYKKSVKHYMKYMTSLPDEPVIQIQQPPQLLWYVNGIGELLCKSCGDRELSEAYANDHLTSI